MGGTGVQTLSGKSQVAIAFLKSSGTDPSRELLLEGGKYGHL